jgi:hypothetical protein
MSVLELKQEITRMNRRGREEIYAFLVRLKHESPEWRRAAAGHIRAMKKGRGVTAEEMESRLH